MGKRPDMKLRAKDRNTGDKHYILAGWRGDRGIGCKLDREVAKIVLHNGTEITDESHFLDLFEGPPPQQQAEPDDRQDFVDEDDSMPFEWGG